MEVYAQLLGVPRLEIAGASFAPPLSKATLLLYFLAYKGEWCSRDELLYYFYPDSPEDAARSSLRQRLTSLRRAAYSQGLEIEATRLRWPVATDVQAFEQALARGAWPEAAKLYRGQLLEGCALADAPEFESWLEGEREDLHSRWRDAALQHALAHEDAEPEKALGPLRTVLKHDPLDEEALKAYMLAAAHTGRKTEALRAYRSFSGHLKDALELQPTAASQELAGAIERGEVAVLTRAAPAAPPASPTPFTLSWTTTSWTTTTSFIGRTREIAQVSQQLQKQDCRLLTILAAGGMGKTRLALQVAQLLSDGFAAGCYVVPLDALHSPEAVPTAIAAALGLELQGQASPLGQIRRFIGEKQLLIVLDNYEHLLDAATLCTELITHCPQLKLLVTSRERLNLTEEWLLELDGLAFPDSSASAAEARATEAVTLFIQRAKQVRPDFDPQDDDVRHIVTLCQAVQGSPLAIELSATWVRAMPCADIVGELRRSLDFLSTSSRNVPERHRSLRATLEHSWKLLTTLEQETLKRLAVFMGGVTRDAAAVVAGASLAVLVSLVDKSLLRATSKNRYDQHPLLYHYTREKLAEQPELQRETQRKHTAYFLRLLERQNDAARQGRQREALEEVDAELANLLGLAKRALEEGQQRVLVKAMRLLAVDGPYLMARGYNPELFDLLNEAAHAAKAAGDQGAAQELLAKLGDAYQSFLADLPRAFAAYQEAYDLARQTGHATREAVFLSLLGVVEARQGKAEEAQTHLEQAYELAQALGDDLCLAAILEQWGYVVATSGSWAQAQRLFRESLAVLSRLGKAETLQQPELDRRHFFALVNLSEAERQLKNFSGAQAACQEARALAEASSNEIWLAHVTYNLGDIHHDMGERELAEQHFLQALGLYRTHDMVAYVERITAFLETQDYQVQGGEDEAVRTG